MLDVTNLWPEIALLSSRKPPLSSFSEARSKLLLFCVLAE